MSVSRSLFELCSDSEGVSKRLREQGLDDAAVVNITSMFGNAARRLLEDGKRGPETVVDAFWVPGRIEVVGKHTDYAGGRSLLCAVNRGFAVVAARREDARVGIFTRFLDGRPAQCELEVTADMAQLDKLKALSSSEGGWALYPAAVVQRLAMNFAISVGADIGVECNLPEASGMSSSSAVVCYMWLVLEALNGVRKHPAYLKSILSDADLYTYLGNIENGKTFKPGRAEELPGAGGVGTFGGSEDHTAIMSAKPGLLGLWQYCPTEHLETVAMEEGVTFVVAVSGAKAEKTGEAMRGYNDASLLAHWASAAYTASRARSAGMQLEKPLTEEDVTKLFDRVQLYNRKLPNLAEAVRQVRAELGQRSFFGSMQNSGLIDGTRPADAEIQSSICASLESFAPVFKQYLEVSRTSLGLNLDGLDNEAITMDTLVVRFQQFFEESEVINPKVTAAFQACDYVTLGHLTDRSHEATVSQLMNTIPETAWLPRWARRGSIGKGIDGPEIADALAASAFGAGFGGSCWALVRSSEALVFRDAWESAYSAAFPKREGGLQREFFVVSPSPGAFAL